ncbi:iron ABC transporter permease, partial [bacterium]|nr:iron ABC transporter permease [candidate division CSSED10-310 bacterium]
MRHPLVAAALLLILVCVTALFIGRYPMSPVRLVSAVLHPDQAEYTVERTVIFAVRMPRILMALLIGASLAMAGTVLQGVFRNPLAAPNILGISSGAGFGAALMIVLFDGRAPLLQLGAFCCGLSAVIVAAGIAARRRHGHETTLILAGIAISSLFTALLSLLKALADPDQQLPAIVFWTLGGLHRATWPVLAVVTPIIVTPLMLIVLSRWKLNVLTMGDLEARSLGLHPRNARHVFIALATL